MDAFFASVEITLNPSLKGKAVIVGGSPESRGVVATCSYEARRYGVHSAMSTAEALRRCPHAHLIHGNYKLYSDYSKKVFSHFYALTHKVEPMSIDEAYLDLSDIVSNDAPPLSFGSRLKKAIFDDTKLSCSVGIASNKLVAKVASSVRKPNGLVEVLPGNEAAFLAPFDISVLPGVGPVTKQLLNSSGFYKIGELQRYSRDQLLEAFGSRGWWLWRASRGISDSPVDWEEHSPKSISTETTFDKDSNDIAFLQETLKELLSKAHRSLLRHKMRTKGVALKLRFSNFRTINRSTTFPTHTKDFNTILTEAINLLQRSYTPSSYIRLIGITLEKLTDSYWQPTLWNWERDVLPCEKKKE